MQHSLRVSALLSLLAAGLAGVQFNAAHALAASRSLRAAPVALAVDTTGIYRISGADLRAHGISWNGIPASALAVTSAGKPVPRLITGGGTLSDTSSLEFYGRALNNRYTARNVYYLAVDSASALAARSVAGAPGGGSSPATFQATYLETRRAAYDPMASGDGWVFNEFATTGDAVTRSTTIELPGAASAGSASIAVRVRGVTDLGGTGPQHHVRVTVNGTQVADLAFSGTGYATAKGTFPASDLSASTKIGFVLPGDVKNKYNTDLVDVQDFTVTYPRQFTAVNGLLSGSFPAGRITVNGLPRGDVTVWRAGPGAPAVLTGVQVKAVNGGYQAVFSVTSPGQYAVAADSGALKPAAITPAADTAYLEQGSAQLLVIGTPTFLSALTPLLNYHRAHGTTVKTVNVADIFTRYSHGVVTADAIHTYLTFAQAHLGTTAVMLVGGDTFDPRNYESCTAKKCPGNHTNTSYVPSLYTRDDFYGQIPSDERLVDSASGPTMAIGRIPAMNVGQVNTVVKKTMAFLQNPGPARAVFAAGGDDPSFQSTSDALSALLPAAYTVTQASTDTLGAKQARSTLFDSINSGARLVDYVGHGSLEQWGQPPALITIDDMKKLANPSPAVFLGWGCQTAYDVDPTDEALNARLLFNSHGAFLALGSTGLDLADPQAAMAEQFFHELFHDPNVTTVGAALRQAEVQALALDAGTRAPVESYELFGDPDVPLSGLQG